MGNGKGEAEGQGDRLPREEGEGNRMGPGRGAGAAGGRKGGRGGGHMYHKSMRTGHVSCKGKERRRGEEKGNGTGHAGARVASNQGEYTPRSAGGEGRGGAWETRTPRTQPFPLLRLIPLAGCVDRPSSSLHSPLFPFSSFPCPSP